MCIACQHFRSFVGHYTDQTFHAMFLRKMRTQIHMHLYLDAPANRKRYFVDIRARPPPRGWTHGTRREGRGGRRHEFFSRFLGFILSIFFFIFLSFIQFLKYVYKLCTRMHTLYTYIRTMYTCIFFCFSIRTYINFDVYAIYPCIQSLYVFIYSIYIHIRRREKNRGGQLAARARPARVSALPANAPRP